MRHRALNTRMETLMMIDPSVKLEAAFFKAMYMTEAQSLLHDKLLVELPNRGRNDGLPDVLVSVERIKSTTLYASCSDAARSGVNIAVEWARALALSSAPSLTAVGLRWERRAMRWCTWPRRP